VVHVGQRECPPVLPSGKSGWLSKSLTIDGKAVVHCPNGPSLFDEAALRSPGRIRMRLAVKCLSKIGRSNLMPAMTFGNWFSPFNRGHVFAAASMSLNTMSLVVFADRAPWSAGGSAGGSSTYG